MYTGICEGACIHGYYNHEKIEGDKMNRKDEAIQAAQDFMKFCNQMGTVNDAFVEEITSDHRTLQQNAFRLMLQCIEKWASDEYGHDARNEQTHEICKRFIDAFKDDPEQLHLPYI